MLTYALFINANILIAVMRTGSALKLPLLIGVTLLFVGLRYEVGFDWPLYKDEFEVLQGLGAADFVTSIPMLQIQFQHETGFLIFSWLSAQILREYELMQLLIHVIFLISFIRLGRVLGVRNLAAAMLLVHLFLLFTLEFSTVRQLLALSLFNLGLAAYMEARRPRALAWFAASLLVQISSGLYLLALLAVSGASRRDWLLAIAGMAAVLAVSFTTFAPALLGMLPGRIAFKFQYYFMDREFNTHILEQVFFGVFYVMVIAFALFATARNRGRLDAAGDIALRFMLALALLAVLFFLVKTVRNRILYELIVVMSLLIFSGKLRYAGAMKTATFAFGAVFFIVSLTKEAAHVYTPYQNYPYAMLFDRPSDGLRRHDRLRQSQIAWQQ